jgi:hypothetical protein
MMGGGFASSTGTGDEGCGTSSQVIDMPGQIARPDPKPRKDLVAHSARFLPAGAEIQQVFIGQMAPNFGYFLIAYLTGLTMFRIKYRCVAVTHDAIYVMESSKLSGGAKPQRLVGTMSRHTRLGPVSSRWGPVNILGERHWVHKRFHDQSLLQTMRLALRKQLATY